MNKRSGENCREVVASDYIDVRNNVAPSLYAHNGGSSDLNAEEKNKSVWNIYESMLSSEEMHGGVHRYHTELVLSEHAKLVKVVQGLLSEMRVDEEVRN